MARSDTQPAAAAPAIAKVPWNPWLGVLFILAVFYAAQFLASFVVEIYPLANHWSSERSLDWLNNSVLAQFVFILVAEVLSVGAVYLFLKRRYKLSLAAIGLKRPTIFDPLVGIAAVIPYFVLFAVAVSLVSHFIPGFDAEQQQQIGFNHVQGGQELVLTFFSLVVLPPIAEEIMVRGFLFSTLKKALPTIYAALLTSVLFGAAHLQEGGSSGLLWIGALDTFVLSLVLIYLRVKTGSLWASITLHAVKNGVAFVSLFVLNAR
jgi:membrane protease YdiL (CAAX protease family)